MKLVTIPDQINFEGTSKPADENKDTGGTLTNLPPYNLEPPQIEEDAGVVAQEVDAGAGPTLSP